MKFAVCAIAKMENHYIREWVEHYKKIGFDNVIIYDNNDNHGERFDEVIYDYMKSGYVIINDVRSKTSSCRVPSSDTTNLQIDCYRKAFINYTEFDWILFVDIDEFLIIDECKTISEFVSLPKFKNCNAIKFAWKYYDDNDLIEPINNNYNLMSRFTRHNDNSFNNSQGKCMLKTGVKMVINSAHCFGSKNNVNTENVICLGSNGNEENSNTVMMNRKNISTWHKYAWINHYRYKTITEFAETKCMRLYPDQSAQNAKRLLTAREFFKANKETQEKQNIFNKITLGNNKNTTVEQYISARKSINNTPLKPIDQNKCNQIASVLTAAQQQRLLKKLK